MEGKGYTEAQILTMAEKIRQNRQEELQFEKNLHSLLSGDKKLASKPLVIGRTTNILAMCGADANLPLTITKKVIEKCMRPEMRDENGKRLKKSGHGLGEGEISKLYSQLQVPVLMFYGNHSNSFVVITELKDLKERGMLAAIDLSVKDQHHEVNQITTYYGHEHFDYFIKDNIEKGNLLAINKEKADKLFQSIGVSFPKEEKFISFDNTIAYSTESVKYPKMETKQKILGKEENAGSCQRDHSSRKQEKGSMIKKTIERSEKKSLLGNLAVKNKRKKKKNSDNNSPNTMGGR